MDKMKKMLNIDQFGRFKGGLPNKKGKNRGTALGEPGTRYVDEHVDRLDPYPEYPTVSEERA